MANKSDRQKKRNRNYWQRRFLVVKQEQEKKNEPYAKKIRKLFDESNDKIEQELRRFYRRYAENDIITEEAARALLTKAEQRTWTMTLQEFRRKAITGGFEQELNREYYTSRVSRLQQLQTQMKMHLFELAGVEHNLLQEQLMNRFTDSYLHNVYEVQNMTGQLRAGVAASFTQYSERQIEAIIKKPWHGSNFSKRVWGNDVHRLPDELQSIMTTAVQNGQGVDEIAKAIQGRFDIAKNRAITLAQSEAGHIAEEASMLAYEETGVKKYMYLSTLEVHTCDVCGDLDTAVFDVKKREVGVNYPLMHPNCRCTTVPYYEDNFGIQGQRFARDPVTGKRYLTAAMSFSEWKESIAA